jgi:hypothetical protein
VEHDDTRGIRGVGQARWLSPDRESSAGTSAVERGSALDACCAVAVAFTFSPAKPVSAPASITELVTWTDAAS